jgi:hypothetical protein
MIGITAASPASAGAPRSRACELPLRSGTERFLTWFMSTPTLFHRPRSLRLDKGLDSPIKRHVAQDFLLSCRKLRDFFTGSGDRDVIAGHYVTTADFHLPVSDKWKEAIDRQLAHISLDRVENSREILRPTQAALYAELRTAWKLFLVNLPTLYQIDFDRELSEKEKLKEFGGLDLR